MFPKPQSRSQKSRRRAAERLYIKLRDAYLQANPRCARCNAVAVLVHHLAGRLGELLTDVRNFAALCRACHDWIHAYPVAARAAGWMQSRHKEVLT